MVICVRVCFRVKKISQYSQSRVLITMPANSGSDSSRFQMQACGADMNVEPNEMLSLH